MTEPPVTPFKWPSQPADKKCGPLRLCDVNSNFVFRRGEILVERLCDAWHGTDTNEKVTVGSIYNWEESPTIHWFASEEGEIAAKVAKAGMIISFVPVFSPINLTETDAKV
jgi:hypothetical protein